MSESTSILAAYAAFPALAILAFLLLEARTAAVALYFGGWLLLPVVDFPAETMTPDYFTVEIIGVGLPSHLGLNKGVVVPLCTLAAWIMIRARRADLPRPVPLDLAMAGFCLWPILAAAVRGSGMASGVSDAVYLAASWGASWLLARALLRDPQHWITLLRGAAWSGVLLLPVAIIEGVSKPWLYQAVWGKHAFLLEGTKRYIGYRPLGFFEHGNQYALWIALAALAWLALARSASVRLWEWPLALATATAVVASQSAGAVFLLIGGGVALLLPGAWLRRSLIALGIGVLLLGAVYLSGRLPAERIAHGTAIGQKVVSVFNSVGRRSFLYRVRRDQMALPLLGEAPLAGTGQWDWWRPLGSHPWGLPLLIVGQYGAVSLLLVLIALLVPAFGALYREDRRGIACAVMVLVAAIDALSNSFIYFPAVLFAAALVGGSPPKTPEFRRMARPHSRKGGDMSETNDRLDVPLPDDPSP